ncbi:MAG: hypothetical protein M1343_04960 [Chloroflexi bacterium]|nr:hypothetical protein [Chloroflexota bacterium]
MKRRRKTPQEGVLELIHLSDKQLTRLLDFGKKCGGIEISTRSVKGDCPREIPLLPIGDTWEAIAKIKVELRGSEGYGSVSCVRS